MPAWPQGPTHPSCGCGCGCAVCGLVTSRLQKRLVNYVAYARCGAKWVQGMYIHEYVYKTTQRKKQTNAVQCTLERANLRRAQAADILPGESTRFWLYSVYFYECALYCASIN